MMILIKAVIVIIEIIIAYLLQTSVFTELRLADVVPDILMILTASLAYIFGRRTGTLTGFLCGMLIDCTYGSLIGLYALLYTVTGYLAGYAHKVGGAEFLINLMYYVLFYFLRGDLDLGHFLVRYLFPRVIYTVLLSIILYRLINMNNALFYKLSDGMKKKRVVTVFKGFDTDDDRQEI